MSDKLTVISLLGSDSAGWMEYGDVEPEKMIETYRAQARNDKRNANQVLAAANADFRIEVVRGVHVQRRMRIVQEGRKP